MAGTTIGSGTVVSGYALTAPGYTLVNLGTINGNGVVSSALSDVVVNAGDISGRFFGVRLHDSGYVTNQSGGTIYGSIKGVYTDAPGTLVNAGRITGNDYGVIMAGGSVYNKAGGAISSYQGIYISVSGTVMNAGSIHGKGYGVRLASGYVTNASGASIDSPFDAVAVGAGAITNQFGGTISGFNHGVDVSSGAGTVINAGSISAHYFGVLLQDGGTIVNAGSISGSGGTAASLAAGFTNRVVVDPGAAFTGIVDGGNAIGGATVSTLELASGASAGTLSGLGTQFVNFGSIVIDPGATWFIAGNTSGLSATISGFDVGDTIEVTGLTETVQTFAGGILGLGGQQVLTLNLSVAGSSGGLSGAAFVATPVPGGTDITLGCFVSGTRIRTARGEVAVEALGLGDLVNVVLRQHAEPVVWTGRRHIDCRRHPRPKNVWPVRIAAGALGPGRPLRDLWLSPDHGVFVTGVLVPVKYLINGTTIVQVSVDEVTYHHVELPQHNLLLAEALPVESYLDIGDRGNFDSSDQPIRLFPDFAARAWEAYGCVPVAVAGPQLDAALAWVAALRRDTAQEVESPMVALLA